MRPSRKLAGDGDGCGRRAENSWRKGNQLGWADEARFGAMLMPDDKLREVGPPSLFRGLSDAEVSQIVGATKRQVLYRGAPLFSQGRTQDGIYLIETGRIRVFYSGTKGREITLAYWHPGNFVGGPDVFNNGVHVWSGAAAINSTVLHLPADTLRSLIDKIPRLAIGIIEGLSFKGRCYSALAQMLGTRSPAERLSHLLLHLLDIYGVPERGGVLIAAPFTHADLAHMIGVTRQSVTITLKRLVQNSSLESRGSNLFVKDTAPLLAMRDGSDADQV